MRKQILIYLFFLLAITTHAQNVKPGAYSKEISFTTDNDAYLFNKNDAYYTNGFFFELRTAKEKNEKKIIQAYEVGQMIYTPLDRKTTGPTDIDRPYCGYLFFQYKRTSFPKNNAVLQYTAGVGEVGMASGGEAVQNGYHKLLGYGRFTGWQYQVQNAFGADVGATYAKTFLDHDSSWLKLMPVAQANLGMNFTNARLGTYLCIGMFENNSNSALWNAHVQAGSKNIRRKYELFFYWYPQVILQGYNATVQGGLLSKGTSAAVLAEIARWMFQENIGLCYAQGRWSTNIAYIYQTKEAVSQTKAQRYVSAQVSYRLH